MQDEILIEEEIQDIEEEEIQDIEENEFQNMGQYDVELLEEEVQQLMQQMTTSSEQLDTLIELQLQNNEISAQNNVNQLFAIGCLSALFVVLLLYNFIKRFI